MAERFKTCGMISERMWSFFFGGGEVQGGGTVREDSGGVNI